jgi:Ca2+-binding EF-hand superfamily protein
MDSTSLFKIYDRIDANQDGVVTKRELLAALHSEGGVGLCYLLDLPCHAADVRKARAVQRYFADTDVDKDGTLSWEEFLGHMGQMRDRIKAEVKEVKEESEELEELFLDEPEDKGVVDKQEQEPGGSKRPGNLQLRLIQELASQQCFSDTEVETPQATSNDWPGFAVVGTLGTCSAVRQLLNVREDTGTRQYALKTTTAVAASDEEGESTAQEVQVLQLLGSHRHIVQVEHIRHDYIVLELLHSHLYDHRSALKLRPGYILAEKVAGHYFAQLSK